MTLDMNDVEVTTGCAAVHPDQRGGQHVAMSCTGVLMTHRPSGVSVLANNERSQYKNRIEALRLLCEALAAVDA